MSIINAIILGLVQGITEFIPVSSSGHLVIFSQFLNLESAFVFDVLLNFGTLLALVIFYRKKLWNIIKRLFSGREWSLVLKVMMATIPAVGIGLTFNDQIEILNTMTWIVVVMLIIVGVLMVIYGKPHPEADDREIEKSVGWKLALDIGLAQAVALIPGTSRSGITTLTGIRGKLSAARAAEFSFLLAIPVILGATVKTLLSSEGIDFIQSNMAAFLVGNLASFIAGIAAVSFFIKLISKRGLKDFGIYRICLAFVLIILLLVGVL